MTSKNYPIGIFDSGVGGLSILQAIHQYLPNENLIYVADTEHSPYGNKSQETIKSRTLKIADFLNANHVKAIVVACNTATAAAVSPLRDKYDFPIIGVEPALKPASETTINGRVGVIATQSTLDSQKYQTLKENYGKNIKIIEKASPLFVELVENGVVCNTLQIDAIQKELTPFKEADIDCLVLGCTHYPFLIESIESVLGKQVKIFESGLPVAKEVKRQLNSHLTESNNKANIQYFSSQPEKAKSIFESLLNEPIVLNKF